MKKFILLILVIFTFVLQGLCETIPPRGVPMTKETHPIYWSYFENYSDKLQEALERKKC